MFIEGMNLVVKKHLALLGRRCLTATMKLPGLKQAMLFLINLLNTTENSENIPVFSLSDQSDL